MIEGQFTSLKTCHQAERHIQSLFQKSLNAKSNIEIQNFIKYQASSINTIFHSIFRILLYLNSRKEKDGTSKVVNLLRKCKIARQLNCESLQLTETSDFVLQALKIPVLVIMDMLGSMQENISDFNMFLNGLISSLKDITTLLETIQDGDAKKICFEVLDRQIIRDITKKLTMRKIASVKPNSKLPIQITAA